MKETGPGQVTGAEWSVAGAGTTAGQRDTRGWQGHRGHRDDAGCRRGSPEVAKPPQQRVKVDRGVLREVAEALGAPLRGG